MRLLLLRRTLGVVQAKVLQLQSHRRLAAAPVRTSQPRRQLHHRSSRRHRRRLSPIPQRRSPRVGRVWMQPPPHLQRRLGACRPSLPPLLSQRCSLAAAPAWTLRSRLLQQLRLRQRLRYPHWLRHNLAVVQVWMPLLLPLLLRRAVAQVVLHRRQCLLRRWMRQPQRRNLVVVRVHPAQRASPWLNPLQSVPR
jgi:hypothetical protein